MKTARTLIFTLEYEKLSIDKQLHFLDFSVKIWPIIPPEYYLGEGGWNVEGGTQASELGGEN